VVRQIQKVVARVKAAGAATRERHAWVDHLMRAKTHYEKIRGDRLAAAVTYFGFLSLFPLLILAYGILGYLVEFFPDVRTNVTSFLSEQFPGIDIEQITGVRATAGIIGLAGLLLAGLGWVSALREALRAVWRLGPPKRNFIVQRAFDALVLAILGLSVLVSLGISNVATNTTQQILELMGLAGSGLANFLLPIVTTVLSIGVDMVVIVVAFTRLPGVAIPRPSLLRGALLGAVGVEVLKLLGSFFVGRIVSNPAYAPVAIAAGLLIWIDLLSRLLLFTACWTYTSYAERPANGEMSVEPNESDKSDRTAKPDKTEASAASSASGASRLSRLVLAGLATAGLVGFRLGRSRLAASRPSRPSGDADPG
jgi:membrane protein